MIMVEPNQRRWIAVYGTTLGALLVTRRFLVLAHAELP